MGDVEMKDASLSGPFGSMLLTPDSLPAEDELCEGEMDILTAELKRQEAMFR